VFVVVLRNIADPLQAHRPGLGDSAACLHPFHPTLGLMLAGRGRCALLLAGWPEFSDRSCSQGSEETGLVRAPRLTGE
jgi:hypothetical protein